MALHNWMTIISGAGADWRKEQAEIRKKIGPPHEVFKIADECFAVGLYRVPEGVLQFQLNHKDEIMVPSCRLFTTDEMNVMMRVFQRKVQ